MKRNEYQPFPLIFFLAAAYSAGIVVAYFHSLSLPSLIVTILVLSLLWLVYSSTQEKEIKSILGASMSVVFPLVIFLLLGMFFTSIKTYSLEESALKKSAGQHQCLDVQGTALTEGKTALDYVIFGFRVERIKLEGRSFAVSELTRVTVKRGQGVKPFSLVGGEKVNISSVVPMSPSSESLKRSLYNQEIQTLLMVDSSQLKIVKKAPLLPRLLNAIRGGVKKRAFQFLNPKEAALLLGILLGEKDSISSLTQTRFAQAGVSHVVAVSGLHVGMMALICFWLARMLRLRTWQKYALTVGLVIMYALVTGCRPSVLRASLVIGMGILGWLLGREKHLVALLSAAALILLVYNPFWLFEVAFQLSFAAAFAIAIVLPVLQFQFNQLPVGSNRFFQLFLVSVAAQAGIVPVAMYHFSELSLVSAMANVFVVPLIAPILGLGLLGTIVSSASARLAHPLFWILSLLLSSVLKLVSLFANLSFSSFSAGISLPALVLYYLLLTSLVVYLRICKKALNPKILLVSSLIVPLGVIWWQLLVGMPPSEFNATFFDVGQGDAAVIRAPSGASIMIDGGQDPYAVKRLLLSKGVCKIDVLVMSHPHADHLNGLVEVVERSNVGLVLVGKFRDTSPKYREFRAAILERQIPCQIAREGMQFRVGPDLELTVLSSSKGSSVNAGSNNASLVAKVEYQDLSLLFPGDVESRTELELLDWQRELGSSVLKVSHHGSPTGANQTFLESVRPKVAVISVGENNRFGHPAASTINALKGLGAKIYRTDRDGSVTITSDGHGFEVSTEK